MARKRRTHEEFIIIFNKISNGEYELLSKYLKSSEKIKIRHNNVNCNFNEFWMTPNSFLQGHRCPKCMDIQAKNKRRKTQEQFVNEVYNLVKEEYTVLGNYKSDSTKILIRHNCDRCKNYEYNVQPNSFLQGARCPKCNGGIVKTHESYIEEILPKIGNEYTILSTYVNDATKLKIRHNSELCNFNEFEMKPSKFLSGQRCPVCQHVKSGKPTKNLELFKKEVYDLVGKEYTIIDGKYINSHSKIKIKHNICNNEYSVSAKNFLRGRRCPFCNESKGEIKISDTLTTRNIIPIYQEQYSKLIDKYIKNYYIPQMKFDGLLGLGNGLLSYDFYIPKLNLLIEYQGEQHERYIPGFHKTYDDFEKQLEHDRRKKEYAKLHNINLLEIWYWDFDKIEKILDRELEVFNIGK